MNKELELKKAWIRGYKDGLTAIRTTMEKLKAEAELVYIDAVITGIDNAILAAGLRSIRCLVTRQRHQPW